MEEEEQSPPYVALKAEQICSEGRRPSSACICCSSCHTNLLRRNKYTKGGAAPFRVHFFAHVATQECLGRGEYIEGGAAPLRVARFVPFATNDCLGRNKFIKRGAAPFRVHVLYKAPNKNA